MNRSAVNRLGWFFSIVSLALVANIASASVITNIHEFSVSPVFTDNFSDGNPPPSAPDLVGGGAASYFAPAGFPSGAESGGKLQLDSSLGGPYVNAIGDSRKSQFATLSLNLLSLGVTDISGKFDLVAPPARGDAYGLYMLGFGPSASLELDFMVWHGFDDALSIFLVLQDFVSHTITPIAQAPVDFGFAEIALEFDVTNGIIGSYTYLDNNGVPASAATVLGSIGDIPGISVVETGFFAGEAVGGATVPEPMSIALFGIGIVALSMFSRRRIS